MKSAVIIVALFLSLFTTVSALANTSIFSGYGYGYGVCSADMPTGLAEAYTSTYKHLHFTWDAVSFNSCEHTTPTSYEMYIRKNNSTIVQTYTGLTSPTKSILPSILQSNHAYTFQTRAIAADGSHTHWSLKKLFRTIPDKPKNIAATAGNNSVQVTWNNVLRSKFLHYYRVLIRHKGHTVTSKKVTLGLHSHSTGITISHLHSARKYTVWIRGVASGPTKGQYAKVGFTTL